jgi:uncharacterized membrane protein
MQNNQSYDLQTSKQELNKLVSRCVYTSIIMCILLVCGLLMWFDVIQTAMGNDNQHVFCIILFIASGILFLVLVASAGDAKRGYDAITKLERKLAEAKVLPI